MAAERASTPVTIAAPGDATASGAHALGTADLTFIPAGKRKMLAAIYIVGGLALGGASILIPILHLCTVWFLPLLGFYMASRALKRTFSIRSLNGTCPACKASIGMGGREMPDSEWQNCPSCNARLRLQPQATPHLSPQQHPPPHSPPHP